jgi:hypothetical protein
MSRSIRDELDGVLHPAAWSKLLDANGVTSRACRLQKRFVSENGWGGEPRRRKEDECFPRFRPIGPGDGLCVPIKKSTSPPVQTQDQSGPSTIEKLSDHVEHYIQKKMKKSSPRQKNQKFTK